MSRPRGILGLLFVAFLSASLAGQEKSVNPDINKKFQDPNVEEFVNTFEKNGREIFDKRKEIVEACKIKPGMAVADLGAGTGLFTRMFASAVGDKGKVY